MTTSCTSRWSRGLLLLALTATTSGLALPPAHAAGDDTPTTAVAQLDDAAAQRAAAAVAAEDRRLTEIRTVTALARWQGKSWETPYRVSSGTGYTLVLTPRAEPYTINDLLALAPQTFLRMNDGSFLLSEHIAVSPRATLRLAQPGGLVLRLASGPRGFATIASLGGRLELAGEEGARVEISSWNLDDGRPDLEQSDGRAYLRATGGQVDVTHTDLRDLGFWSGRTGGLALTGTDRPNTGAIERRDGSSSSSTPSLLDGVATQPAGALQPGQANPTIDYVVPTHDYVSSRLTSTTITGSAYGLFVTGAEGLQLEQVDVTDSLISGIVLHRYVTNAVLDQVTASGNKGNGISIDRASTGITVSQATASGNERNGLRMSGRPLATGPSATGASTTSYGGNSVSNSTMEDNGRYGIEVVDGFSIGVQNNRVSGGSMGIVVNASAERVSVTGNEVTGTARHGIALTDGVTAATVTGNVVDGASTGVYVRDSTVTVRGNTVQRARVHGISLVGATKDSDVVFNVLGGSGPSALDTMRSDGLSTASQNATEAWDDTTPWYFWFKKLLQPMTALWSIIALLVGTSAVRSRGRDRKIVHPYAHQQAHQGVMAIPQPQVVDLRDGEVVGAGAGVR